MHAILAIISQLLICNASEDCSVLEWLHCSGKFGNCVIHCTMVNKTVRSPSCYYCIGSAYEGCKDCILAEDEVDIQKQQQTVHLGTYKDSAN